jgi:tRNA(fMet)-specific endonuclease VapC
MNALLPDTNVILRLFRGDEQVAANISRFDKIIVPPAVIGEFKMGVEPDTRRGKAQQRQLDAFLDSEHVEVVPTTEATTDYYAAIYRELKARGKPIPTNDMWIAASAIEHHATLYSLDAHFRQIPMLTRI